MKQTSQITRSAETKTWNGTGEMLGNEYYTIKISKSGILRIISAQAYYDRQRYPVTIPVYNREDYFYEIGKRCIDCCIGKFDIRNPSKQGTCIYADGGVTRQTRKPCWRFHPFKLAEPADREDEE